MSRPKTRKLKLRTKPGPTTAMPVSSGNLWLHELRSVIFGNTRLLRVWLPPDYDGWGATRYPVLYLNDGQNLFDPATAFAGVHWRVWVGAARPISKPKIRQLDIVSFAPTEKPACNEPTTKSTD